MRIIWLNKNMRKIPLATGETYHIFCRSIADFRVFNSEGEYDRMQQLIKYYRSDNSLRFSDFINLKLVQMEGLSNAINIMSGDKEQLIGVVAYCLMPTHINLILKQLIENGISKFMKDLLISYTRTFNQLHKRRGPLWESRFKNVLVESDEQLLHLTRYIHLNPVTAGLVDFPEDWIFSSYREYLGKVIEPAAICQFEEVLEIKPPSYRKFVNERISYQRELAKIKNLIID